MMIGSDVIQNTGTRMNEENEKGLSCHHKPNDILRYSGTTVCTMT